MAPHIVLRPLIILSLLWGMAGSALPASPDVSQADYDRIEACLGTLDGANSIMMLLAPQMEHPAEMVQGVISNKGLSDQVKAALRKIEAAQPLLHKLEAGAAYSVAKQPWDDMKSADASAQLAYWQAHGANSPECESLIMRMVAVGALMDLAN